MRHEETLKVAFTFHDLISTKHGSASLSTRACFFPVLPLSSIPIALFTPCAVLCAVLFCYFPVVLLASSCPPRVQCCSVTLLSSLSLLHVHLVYSAVCSAVPLLSCLSSLFFMSTSCAALLLFLSCLPSLFFPHHVALPVCSAASSGKQVSKIAASPSACRFPSDAAPLLPRPSSSLCACLRVPPACSVVPSDDAWQAGAQVASYTSSPSAWPFPSYIPSRSIFTR